MFLSRIAAELWISSLSLWRVGQWVGAELLADESSKEQSRASQQGSLCRAREKGIQERLVRRQSWGGACLSPGERGRSVTTGQGSQHCVLQHPALVRALLPPGSGLSAALLLPARPELPGEHLRLFSWL